MKLLQVGDGGDVDKLGVLHKRGEREGGRLNRHKDKNKIERRRCRKEDLWKNEGYGKDILASNRLHNFSRPRLD